MINDRLRKRRIAAAAALALTASSACHTDMVHQAPTQAAATQSDKRYRIELWELPLVGGFGSHAVIVMRDRRQDQMLALEGLATDRATGDVNPIGRAGRDDIYAYANLIDKAGLENKQWRANLLQTNDGIEFVARMTAMLEAGKAINGRHYSYQLFSSSRLAGREAYNSNATATTLLQAASLQNATTSFDGFAPGWGELIPTGHKVKFQHVHAIVQRSDQRQVTALIEDLAGDVNARGKLAQSSDPIDRDLARVSGVFIGQFIEAMDYNGEQARRAEKIAGYEKLPLCERRLPAFASYDLPAINHVSALLYADNVTDAYSAKKPARDNHGTSYYDPQQYNIMHDPKLNKDCRTERDVSSRSEMQANVKDGKRITREHQVKFWTQPPTFKKPKTRVQINF